MATFEELVAGLEDESPEVRCRSARSLGRYSRRAAIPALVAALRDRDESVVAAAADSLGEVGRRLRGAAPEMVAGAVLPLLEILRKRQGQDGLGGLLMRIAAAESVGKIRLNADEVVPALMEAMDDELWQIRMASAIALGRLRELAAPAVGLLVKKLSDPDELVRYWSAIALGWIGRRTAAVHAALLRVAEDDEEEEHVRWSAAWSLEDLEA